ncbi:NACHT domain-containing protein, partial [Leptolyngbya sp. FACHB-711]|uniref:NACHT domain-containing protein n=1 Tax=Leptolyngbya sp. FACHB-711 TaxID=2692813 RepID=UPI0016892275
LIQGEEGVGKTSLACQIALWALASKATDRPCKHQMLPVILEGDLDLKTAGSKTPIFEAIRGQLQNLADESDPISEALLEQLLRKNRILVIVDGLSERSEETRKQVNPELPDFLINALLVTSRSSEGLSKVTKTTISFTI